MKFPIFALLVVCSLLSACDQLASSSKQDLPRLEAIDNRLIAGEFEVAQREAAAYNQDYPECDQGWRLLGWTHVKLDELDDAKRCFDKSIALNADSDNAYVGLGVVRRKQGDLEGARDAYGEAIRLLPENPEAFSSLLVIEILEKNYQKAVDYGEKAWKLRKDMATIPANLAIAYHYLGDDQKKQLYYAHAKRLNYHRLDAIQEIFDGTLVIE